MYRCCLAVAVAVAVAVVVAVIITQILANASRIDAEVVQSSVV